MNEDEPRPNWYRIAISRGADPAARRRAWKIILALEIVGAAIVVAATYLAPASVVESSYGLVLLVAGAVVFIAVLAWTQR